MALRELLAAAVFLGLPFTVEGRQAPVYTVQGRVENSHGADVKAAAIRLTLASPAVILSELTDASGRFSFGAPQAGIYTLTVATTEGIQEFPAPAGSTEGLVLRMKRNPGMHRHDLGIAPATVSVNDLQAPIKAQTTLVKAEKALEKSDEGGAWKLLNQAIQEAPAWSRAYSDRASISLSRKNYAAARSDLDMALARNPRNTAALTMLGRLEFIIGDTATAQEHLEEALRLPPVYWSTYLDMALLDIRLHRYLAARTLAEKALQDAPPSPAAAYFLIGESYFYTHHYDQAKWNMEVYYALLPDSPANARGRASAMRNLNYLAKHHLVH